ncbi:MAG TPA: class I SAM-dependent methyltransferase [Reyranella sp.]
MQDRLYGDPDLAQFYDLENAWAADLDYCRNLARGCSSVLDLGCGTGLFAAALAQEQNAEIVGVDPAAAMLDVARARPGGERVRWVQGDARSIRLESRFDLVVLTGHAFQVFLTLQDRASALATIASHLNLTGRFVFDSRNPAVEAWKKWTPEKSRREIVHPTLGRVHAWNDAAHDAATGIVIYTTVYEVIASGRRHSAPSKIAFTSREQLEAELRNAGLVVQHWLGDWSGAAWSAVSPEIIPVGSALLE